MLLSNEFVVQRPVAETWAVLTDLERIAPCMPGAQLTSVQGDEYHGKVKVKVGPMTAQFTGVATFKELDADAHRAVIEARGRDATGKGRASALVTAVLVPEGPSATKVKVETDLTIAGPLAQMGRSTIADISGRLLGTFVTNLEAQLAATEQTPADEPTAPNATEGASTADQTLTDKAAVSGTTGPAGTAEQALADEPTVPNPAGAASVAAQPVVDKPAAPDPAGPADTAEQEAASATAGDPQVQVEAQPQVAAPRADPAAVAEKPHIRMIEGPEAEAVDLLQTAGTRNLVKIAVPVAILIVAVVGLVVWLA